ncbi:hypothetical protein C942_00490 [Photobacterium marinum]|uniref:Uncharacterized protein n=1 Tax=Photobacterium marinum TaxID=1056511 RepID=L8JCM4_9GAMM|nr:hypothetical protein C942_00490 [Photobacterium marinum]
MGEWSDFTPYLAIKMGLYQNFILPNVHLFCINYVLNERR